MLQLTAPTDANTLTTLVLKKNDIPLGENFGVSIEHYDSSIYPVSTVYQGVVAGPQSPQVSLNCFEESEDKTAIVNWIEETRETYTEQQWRDLYCKDYKRETEDQ